MNVNEFSANIQYKNSFITECTITNNLLDIGDDAVLKTDVKVAVSKLSLSDDESLLTATFTSVFKTDVKVAVSKLSLSDDETEKLGKVRLTLDGSYSVPDNTDAKLEYHIVLIGEFCTSASTKDEDFTASLWLNGSTALYSIARGKIETISTTVLNNGKIILPMVNMMELLRAQLGAESSEPTN